MSQLCLPPSRRAEVMKLAHDSVFGRHMGDGSILYERYLPTKYADLWHAFKVVVLLLIKMLSLAVY